TGGLPLTGRAVLFAFTAIAAVTAFFHEPWADEAQAWLIARDLSITGVLHQMGYEGSPPLWHLLLWFLTRLHLPYGLFGAVSVTLVAGAVYVWLRWSPLPIWVRLVVPFAFYYQYQYAVVTRSYALSTLLAFAAAALWRTRPVRIIPLAVVLALLAQTNMHGFTIAMGIACAFAWECLRELKKGGVRGAPIYELGVGGVLVLISAVVARALASPYADCSFKAAVQLRKGSRLESITSAFDGLSGFSKAIGLTPSWLLIGVLIVAIWAVAARRGGFRTAGVATILLLAYPVTLAKQPFGILQGVVLALLVLSWFLAVKRFASVLPFVFTVLAMGFVWSRPWHYGMALTAFLVAVWGAWPVDASAKFQAPKLALAVSLAVLVLWQVPATAKSIYSELRGPYSGAHATADYLEPQVGHRRIYCVNFYGTALEPYFDKNIFANWPDAYWTWSTHRAAQANRILDQDLPANAIVVVPFGGLSSPKPARSNAASAKLASQGFQKTREFCGAQFWLGDVSEYECYDIYQRRR
ncbi:MAG TPA: hypothetical protein VF786_14740, partial [Terriglobales bacterium]